MGMSVCYKEQYTKKFLYTAGGAEHSKNKIQQNKAIVVYKTQEENKKIRVKEFKTKSRE
jgi:hypothetical protein